MRKIKNRLTFFWIIPLILIVAVSAVFYNNYKTDLAEKLKDLKEKQYISLKIKIDKLQEIYSKDVTELNYLLKSLNDFVKLNSGLPDNQEELTSVLKNEISPDTRLLKLELYNISGNLITDYSPQNSGNEITDNIPAFVPSESKLFDWDKFDNGANPLIRFTLPVYEDNNKIVAYLVAYHDFTVINNYINQLSIFDTGSFFVSDPADNIIIMKNDSIDPFSEDQIRYQITGKLDSITLAGIRNSSSGQFTLDGAVCTYYNFQQHTKISDQSQNENVTLTAWSVVSEERVNHIKEAAYSYYILPYLLICAVIIFPAIIFWWLIKSRAEAGIAQNKFRGLLEATPDGTVITDSNGIIVLVNPAAVSLFGYKKDELLGKSVEILLPDMQRSKHENLRSRYTANPVSVPMNERGNLVARRKDGTVIPVEIKLSHLRSDNEMLFIASVRDISWRIKAEKESREKDIKFKAIFDQTFTFLGLTKPDGTFTEINSTTLEFFGISGKDVIGKKIYDADWLLNSDNEKQTMRDAVEKAANGEFVRFEINIPDESNNMISLDFTIKPVFDEKGKVIFLLPEGHDISEISRMKQEISSREEILKLFVKHTPTAVAMFNTNIEYLVASDRWYNDYNIQDKDIIGKSHYDIFPEIRKMPEWIKIHQYCVEGNSFRNDEDEFKRADGKSDWIKYEIHPWYTVNNKVGGIIMFTEVITEQVEIRNKLQAEKEKLKKYLSIAHNIFLVVNRNYEVVLINDKGCDVFGYTEDELLGKNWFDMVLPEEEKENLRDLFNSIVDGSREPSKYTEIKMKNKAGKLLTIAWHNTILKDRDGNITGTLSSGEDITEKKQKEEQLYAQAQLLDQIAESVLTLDFEGNIKSFNHGADNLFRLLPVTEPYQHISTLIPRFSPEELKNNFYPKLLKKSQYSIEVTFEEIKKENFAGLVTLKIQTDINQNPTGIICSIVDITKINKANEQIKFQADLLNSVEQAVISTDADFNIVYWNEFATKMYGWERTEVIGRDIRETLGVIKNNPVFDFVKNHKSWTGELYSKDKFGKEFPVHITLSRTFEHEKNQFSGLIGIAYDITEDKKREEEITKLAMVARETSNMVLITDQEGGIEWVNHGFEKITGFTLEEVRGKMPGSFLQGPKTDPASVKRITDAIKNKTSVRTEILKYAKNGKQYWVDTSLQPIFDENGNVIKFFSVETNITEKVNFIKEIKELNENLELRVEERTSQLAESEEKFRQLAENIDQVLWLTSGNKLLYINSAVEKITGYTSEQIYEDLQLLDKITVDEDKHIARYLMTNVYKKNRNFLTELRIRKPDGEIRWIKIKITFFNIGTGSEVRAVGIADDITEVKLLTEAIIESKEKAEEANKAKTEFLANMSHEIRTPMNSIIGFADLLSRTEKAGKEKNYVNAIRTSGKSLMTIINDILDLSKIEAGKIELNKEPIEIYEFIKEIKDIFEVQIADKDLVFRIETEDLVPAVLILDELRLRQVMFNIIGNAIKFTESGFIKLKLSGSTSENNESRINLRIDIQDTGIGIPEDKQQIIFESFRQQDEKVTRKYGGSGLGLTISQRLVKLMNGRIEVVSEVGAGSIFSIILDDVPVAALKALKKNADMAKSSTYEFEKSRLLIADDIKENRDLIKEIFHNTKVEVIEAEDGKEAVEIAEKVNPQLILMDIRMPRMNGIKAAELIRAEKKVPIVAFTASASIAQFSNKINSVFDAFIFKPVNVDELIEKISHYLPHNKEVKIADITESMEDQFRVDEKHRETIVSLLEGTLYEKWEQIKDEPFFEAIINFANELTEIGTEYEVIGLVNYGQELKKYAAEYEIDKMQHTMGMYSQIVEQIKTS